MLRADAEQVRAALAETEAQRHAAESELAASRAVVEASAVAVAKAERAERAAADRAAVIDGQVREAAIGAFLGAGHSLPIGVLAMDDTQDAAWHTTVLQYRADERAALLSRQQAAREKLDAERRARVAAAQEATAAEQRAQRRVDDLVRLSNDQTALVAKVDDRLDAALAESAALAALDQQAAADLARKEQELATAAAMSVTSPAPAPSSSTPARSATRAPVSSTTSPPTTLPPAPLPPSTTAAPVTTVPAGPIVVPSPPEIASVGGFLVAGSIAGQTARLLEASAGAGLSLGGSAYRDVNTQVDLRRQHCGPTEFDIWLKPASQCSPPTAIPGRSMHEKGLAIDFTCAGVLIRDRASPCFVWLAANAASFGFYNLPSEPWHWSTNGN